MPCRWVPRGRQAGQSSAAGLTHRPQPRAAAAPPAPSHPLPLLASGFRGGLRPNFPRSDLARLGQGPKNLRPRGRKAKGRRSRRMPSLAASRWPRAFRPRPARPRPAPPHSFSGPWSLPLPGRPAPPRLAVQAASSSESLFPRFSSGPGWLPAVLAPPAPTAAALRAKLFGGIICSKPTSSAQRPRRATPRHSVPQPAASLAQSRNAVVPTAPPRPVGPALRLARAFLPLLRPPRPPTRRCQRPPAAAKGHALWPRLATRRLRMSPKPGGWAKGGPRVDLTTPSPQASPEWRCVAL